MANFLSIPVADTVETGQATATTSGKLRDSTQDFLTTVSVGDIVYNTTDTTYATVTAVDSDIALSIDTNIMASGEDYIIYSGTESSNRLINAKNMMLTEQTDTNNVTISYKSGASTDVVTIHHYTQATGYEMRDVLQDGFVAAHNTRTAPTVAIQLVPTKVVLNISIG